jgi:hypothetical protein
MAITVPKKKKTIAVARPEEETPVEAPASPAGALPSALISSAPAGHQTIGVAPPVFAGPQVSYGGPVAMAIIAMVLFFALLGLQYSEWEFLKPMFPMTQAATPVPGAVTESGSPAPIPTEIPGMPSIAAPALSGTVAFVVVGVEAIIGILMIAALWKIFSKAGKPGWGSLIPIYNTILLIQAAGKPTWWFFILWLFVPAIIVLFALARSFGKGIGFGFGLLFLPLIFFPILGFGSAQHISATVAATE